MMWKNVCINYQILFVVYSTYMIGQRQQMNEMKKNSRKKKSGKIHSPVSDLSIFIVSGVA